MTRLLEKLPLITLAMSLPLFFTMQLKKPPEFLQGLPFVAFWSWGVLGALSVPILIAIETAVCFWFLWYRTGSRAQLTRHGIALLVAVLAEVVFVTARKNSV